MSDGTLQTLDVTMLDDVGTGANQLIQLDSNAKIPACSGAAITGLSSVTKNASDPAVDTNPSGGVGTVWQNTTSGEMYVCTDATADENVWTNVGAGSGDVVPYHGSGSSYGYCATGSDGPPAWPNVDRIDKFSLVSASNATDVGNITVVRRNCGGASSSTHGYAAGGDSTTGTIDKWSMISDGNATDVGDLVVGPGEVHDGSFSTTYGYGAGGAPSTNQICKYSFTTDGNATDVGDLTAAGRMDHPGGTQSSDYGYCMGGNPATNIIDKWPFATDSDATDVGDLTVAGTSNSGNSSGNYGYSVGGSGRTNVIDKWPFASDANAADVGDLITGATGKYGADSSSHGYSSGGWTGSTMINVIEKFSFASDGNAIDSTQDLTIARSLGAASMI